MYLEVVITLKDKIDGLRDYRYHFCIENIKRDYWFTEKLIDCFVTGTIPIYWGCPSIFDNISELPEFKQCTSDIMMECLNALMSLSIPELLIICAQHPGNKYQQL